LILPVAAAGYSVPPTPIFACPETEIPGVGRSGSPAAPQAARSVNASIARTFIKASFVFCTDFCADYRPSLVTDNRG